MKETSEIELIDNSLKNAMSYQAYRELVTSLVQENSNTGAEQTEALAQYTLLNNSRMKRLDKTTKVPENVEEAFAQFKGNQTWVVLTESWCGDAAQSMPAMNILASLSDKIDFKVVLRDENPALMDQFLTNGNRSIPKLIVVDNNTKTVVGEWGPRPSVATRLVEEFKATHGKLTPDFKQDLQVWYNKDKSQNIIEDLSELVR